MSRDYRKNTGKSKREQSSALGSILSFLSGLSVGLLVAFFVFLRYQLPETAPTDTVGSGKDSQAQAPTARQQPELTFDFYDVLRDRKINISEWMAEEKPGEEEKDKDEVQTQDQSQDEVQVKDNVLAYVLQVGSFKEFNSADQIKAQLALMGIFADIQRVMINGQDIHHRVRLGPYRSVDEMKDVRQTLEDNRIEFMLLELRLEEEAGL